MNFQAVNKTGTLEGFCLIKTVEQKMTARGVPYLDMTLSDSSGEIGAKLWDYKEAVHGQYRTNMLIKARGVFVPFNDVQQFRIERIRPVTDADAVEIADFVPSAPQSGQDMYQALYETAQQFQDADLKQLVCAMLEEYKEKLQYCPAAFRLHHAVRGGLLYHTLSILRLAQGVVSVYPFVDRDLLFAGIILHDICKVEEFQVEETGIATGYTAQGELIGHLVRGAMAVERVGSRLGVSADTMMLVEHMLISHHGDPEFGAAQRPKFLEAEILSQLDLLDARVYEIMQTLDDVEIGQFSKNQWMLENRKIYRHGRQDAAFVANVLPEDAGINKA